ncbi:MAG TPA: hypothetical protein VK879_12315 [Candidatus Sulfomarinibacteraceae bacterium]|nr:hypothetical protein [Candidatus Sulfomarinibacteraceae bacterium]
MSEVTAASSTSEGGFSAKSVIRFALKTLAVAIVLLIVMIVASSVLLPAETMDAAPEEEGNVMLLLFIICFVDALILALVITQSRWRGWPLILGLTFAFYGTKTLVGQIEAIVFLTPLGERWGAGSIPVLTMPMDFIVSQILIGAATAIVGIPVAVFLFRKARAAQEPQPLRLNPGIDARQWLWKLGAIIILYELLYFGFGYYVAWKNPVILAFYQGADPGSFLAQMQNVATQTPTLIPFQAMRALLWTAFALPLVAMLRHKGWAGALLTGLFVSVPMNIPHIVPNAYMPADVRLVHFVETVSSTFIFGLLLFWLLHRSHRSLVDLFSATPRAGRLQEAAQQ